MKLPQTWQNKSGGGGLVHIQMQVDNFNNSDS